MQIPFGKKNIKKHWCCDNLLLPLIIVFTGFDKQGGKDQIFVKDFAYGNSGTFILGYKNLHIQKEEKHFGYNEVALHTTYLTKDTTDL